MVNVLQSKEMNSSYFVKFPLSVKSLLCNIKKALIIEDNTNTSINSLMATANKIDNALRQIFDQIKMISEKFGSVLRLSNPINLHVDVNTAMIQLFERNVKRCLVNNPDNENLKLKWQQFKENFFKLRMNFSQYSSKSNSSLLNETETFSKLIQDELQKINLTLPIEENNIDNSFFNLFIHILNTNEALLDMPMAALAGLIKLSKSDETSILNTSIPHLVDTYNHLLRGVLNDLPWILEVCESKLTPFASLEQNETMNFSKKLLKIIKEIKTQKLPQLQHLYLNDPLDCSIKKKKTIDGLTNYFQKWLKKHESCKQMGFRTFKKNEKTLTQFETPLSGYFVLTADSLHLQQYYDKLLKEQYQCTRSEEYNSANLSNLKLSLDFHHTANECANLMSGFFRFPMLNISALYDVISKWAGEEKTRLFRAKYEEQSIDDLVRKIEGDRKTPKSKKRKKRRPSAPSLQTVPTLSSMKEENPSPILSKKLEKATPPISGRLPAVDYAQILQPLEATIKSCNDPLTKDTARQAYMYAQDISAIYKNLQNASNDSSLLYYLISLLHSEFFFLEQTLNYQGLTAGGNKSDAQNEHNLSVLAKDMGLESTQNKNRVQILKDFFLMPYWIRSTYEQLRERDSWDTPPYLHAVQTLYESNHLSKQIELINKIKDSYARVFNFSSGLPALKTSETLPNEIRKIEVVPLQHQTEIAENPCDEMASRCNDLFNRVSFIWHPKLKQIFSHLKILKGILHELNKKSIDSDLFSLLVRHCLFWENTILEEFLQLANGVQTGTDTFSHDLKALFAQLIKNKKKDGYVKDNQFLTDIMPNLHNFSRYPYTHHGSEIIHSIVWKAELLREVPELNQGFKIQKKTVLNYHEVSSDRATSEDIIQDLNNIHTRIFNIIHEQILPRLPQKTIQMQKG